MSLIPNREDEFVHIDEHPVPGCGFCRHIAPGRHDVCVICGQDDHAGLGMWAVHFDDPNDTTPVHTGRCWRTYQAKAAERKTEQHWLTMFALWGGV